MSERDEPLLMRWSRRKTEARRREASPAASAAAPQAKQVPAPEVAAPHAMPAAPAPSPEPVRVEDLPDVDSLEYESDFTVFLRTGVPEELRRRALRKLWTSDPVLANLDGLNDYDPSTMKFLVEDVDVLEIASAAVQNHTGSHSGADGFRAQAKALAERRAEPPAPHPAGGPDEPGEAPKSADGNPGAA